MVKTTFSPIIAGTMTWGMWGKDHSPLQMAQLIATCLEHGIHSFDHADIYGNYTTEATFGKALREGQFQRSSLQLISKCGIQMPSVTRGTHVKHYDYSAPYIIQSVESSLMHLQTDYLDLLLLHRPSPVMRPEVIAKAVETLKTDGKILDFGVSNFTPSQMQLIGSKTTLSYNQIEFSVTHLEPMLDGCLDHMQLHGIRPMAWSPLGTVFKGSDERSLRVKRMATDMAAKYEVPVDVLLIAWMLEHPAGILPVCGTTEPARITRLMEATRLEWEIQDWFALWTASAGQAVP